MDFIASISERHLVGFTASLESALTCAASHPMAPLLHDCKKTALSSGDAWLTVDDAGVTLLSDIPIQEKRF